MHGNPHTGIGRARSSSRAMRVLPIALAVALAAGVAWRWRRLGWPSRAAAGALAVVLVISGAGLVHVPRLETMIESVGSTVGPYVLVLVGVMAFLETGAFVGLLVPGETVVIVGGVVAGQGHVAVLPLLGLTWLCALAGDLSGYGLGRRLGRRFLLAHGARVHITTARLLQVEAFFARYGAATILIGRFVGLVRPLAPFLAGASRYPAARYSLAAVLGTGLWSAAFVLLGFLFWRSFDEATAIAKQGALALWAVVLVGVSLVAGYRFLRARRLR